MTLCKTKMVPCYLLGVLLIGPPACSSEPITVGASHHRISAKQSARLAAAAARVPASIKALANGKLAAQELVVGYTGKRLAVSAKTVYSLHVTSLGNGQTRYLHVNPSGQTVDKQKLLLAERNARRKAFGCVRPDLYQQAAAAPGKTFEVRILIAPRVPPWGLSRKAHAAAEAKALVAPRGRVLTALASAGAVVATHAMSGALLEAKLSGSAIKTLAHHADLLGIWPLGRGKGVMNLLSQNQAMGIPDVFYPQAGGPGQQELPGYGVQLGLIDKAFPCGVQQHPAFLFPSITNLVSGPSCSSDSDCPSHDAEQGFACRCDTTEGICIHRHSTLAAASIGSEINGDWVGAPFVSLKYSSSDYAYAHSRVRSTYPSGGIPAGVVVVRSHSLPVWSQPDKSAVHTWDEYDQERPVETYDPVVDAFAARGGYTTFKTAGNQGQQENGVRYDTYVSCSLASICVGGYEDAAVGFVHAAIASFIDPCRPQDTACDQLPGVGCDGDDCLERPHVVGKAKDVEIPDAPAGGINTFEGTSFAAPAIAGLAALLWAAPGLELNVFRYSPEATKAVLMASGDLHGKALVRYDTPSVDGSLGAGQPRADRIMEIAEQQQAGSLDLASADFVGDKRVLASNISVPVGHTIRAVMAHGTCHSSGEEQLSVNLDLELVCDDQNTEASSRSAVNEHEILEYEAELATKTCNLIAHKLSWQDCVIWHSRDPDTGQPIIVPDRVRVGFAYYITNTTAGD